MVNSRELESEYESELESVLLRRRSKASDDDDEVVEGENKVAVSLRLSRSVRGIGYAEEYSDGRDGAPEYYNDDDDDEEEEEVSYIDKLEKLGEEVQEEREEEVAGQVTATEQRRKEKVNDDDNAAFAVPRSGAFYMHDDRLGGLRRRSRDQRRKKNLWESKDELKWMHDKFEEMTMEETHTELNTFEVHRTSNGYHRGGNKKNTRSGGYEGKEYGPFSKSGNNGSSSIKVKGRGPVRYKPLSRSISANSPVKSMQEKTQGTKSRTDSGRVFSANNKQQYRRLPGKTANADSGRALSTKCKQPAKQFEKPADTGLSKVVKSKQSRDLGMTSFSDPANVTFHGLNADYDSLPSGQRLLGSSMSSYLQALHPASSFHHDISETQKRMVLDGSRNAAFLASVLPNQNSHVPPANEFLQGNIVLDIPYAKKEVSPVAENYFTKLSFQYSVPGSTYIGSPESRDLGIGSSLSIPFSHQATACPIKLSRASSQAQPNVQKMPVDSPVGPPSQVFSSIQPNISSLGIGSNITHPPQYIGIQSDQNFSATSILFPVMQIGGLHPGSLGDLAIDMTSTGCISESQVHLRNPDLTWLPILRPATEEAGATCQPPFFAPDGNCYGNLMPPPFVDIASYATHTSISIPGIEAGTSGPSDGSRPSLGTGYVKKTAGKMSNECGIQRFKPKRYSMMNMKE